MSRPPRAAIAGTGFMASVHAEALRRLSIEVIGVVGSSPERAAAQAHDGLLPAPYDSYEALLADERVDVVHITSPNHLHHAQALAALEAGKHVICEKPLALTSDETAELADAAERSGRVHAVNFMSRFYAQCQEARRRVRSGALGPVRLISGGYLQDWMADSTDWNWRVDPDLGGRLRAVGDIGSHWLDLVTFITGSRVEAVMADLTTAVPVRHQPPGAPTGTPGNGGASTAHRVKTEDIAGLLLRLEDGARGVVAISQVSPGRKNLLSMELDGEHASLSWASERPEELWIGHRHSANELILRDPALMAPGAGGSYPAGHAEGFPDAFKALYASVYRAIAAGEPPAEPDYPTFADGHEQALVADAIARSAAAGRWEHVDRPIPASHRPPLTTTTTSKEHP